MRFHTRIIKTLILTVLLLFDLWCILDVGVNFLFDLFSGPFKGYHRVVGSLFFSIVNMVALVCVIFIKVKRIWLSKKQ